MAKNLIQRMARGGDVVNLQEHIPGTYIDKELANMLGDYRYNKEFKEKQRQFNIEVAAGDTALAEEQRQFNEQAGIERERNRIASEGVRTDKEIAFQGLKDKALDRKRDDWDAHSSGLSWTAQIALAGDDPDLASKKKYAQEEKILYDEAMRQWNSAKTGNNPLNMKVAMDKHRDTIERSAGGADKLTSWQTEIEGASAKSALQSLAGNKKFMAKLTDMGMNTSTFSRADLSNSEALFWLQQIPQRMEQNLAERRVSSTEKTALATAFSPVITALNSQVEAAYESGSARQLINLQSDFTNLYDKYLSDLDIGYKREDRELEVPEVDLTEEELDRLGRTVKIVTGTGETKKEVPVVFDADSKYILELTKASGEKITKTVKGSNAASIQKQRGWEISKAEKIIKPLKFGRPQLDSGVVVQDTKTGKTLTYVGFDFPPKGGIVTVGGKKTRQDITTVMAGGLKVLYFKDEAGKSVVYTPRDIEKTNFIEPPAGQEVPDEDITVAEEGAGVGEEAVGGGLGVTAIGADMGGREGYDAKWNQFKGQVDSVQSAIDLFLREDEALQELEDNE